MSRTDKMTFWLVVLLMAIALFSAWLMANGMLPIQPKTDGDEDTLMMGTYSVLYRSDLRIPVRARWTLDAADLGSSQREPSWRFQEDTRVAKPRATHDDYLHSGYDRGHMVPAADRSRDISLMKHTFIMTNVCPQVPSLNRGPWKALENACRREALRGEPLIIVADAVFWVADTQRIGQNAVAVPHGFVKTVYNSTSDSILYARYFQNW